MALWIDIWSDGKTTMATDLIMASSKILHLATPIDANDALNKSYVDTSTNNLLQTDWTKPMCADFNMSNKKINLVTPTNSNDSAIKSYVDGVKQAATLGSYLYTCLIMKWVMIIKMKPNSNSQDQNMQFPMIYISHYTVRN